MCRPAQALPRNGPRPAAYGATIGTFLLYFAAHVPPIPDVPARTSRQRGLCAPNENRDAAPEMPRWFPHFPPVQTYMWSTPASRRAAASGPPLPECPAAVLHSASHCPGSTVHTPPGLCGTSPHRSRERPPRSGERMPETAPPADPASRWSPLRGQCPSAPHSEPGSSPGPGGSRWTPADPRSSCPRQDGSSCRREPHTGPAPAPRVLLLPALPPPWRLAPAYSKVPPRGTHADQAGLPFHNKSRFSSRAPVPEKREPAKGRLLLKASRYSPAEPGPPAAHKPPGNPHILPRGAVSSAPQMLLAIPFTTLRSSDRYHSDSICHNRASSGPCTLPFRGTPADGRNRCPPPAGSASTAPSPPSSAP